MPVLPLAAMLGGVVIGACLERIVRLLRQSQK